jgi:hypothetical protein
MFLFFQSWLVILQMSAPAILLMLLTILWVRKSNPLGYQMGWAHFFIFILYSLFFAYIYAQAAQKTGNGGAEFALEMTILVIITPAHLLIYWVSLFMSKPDKKAKYSSISEVSDDPILDERPPTK